MLIEAPFQSDQEQREIFPVDMAGFPCLCRRNELDWYPDRTIPWHWHNAFEINYIEDGTLLCQTPEQTITLHKDLQTHNMAFNNAFYDPTRYYYCSAPGKMLLSTYTDEELEDYLSNTKIIIFTKTTLPTPDAIREEIQRVKQQGYSIHDEEWLTGNLTISFPLRVNGVIRGAMSLMCDIDRKQEMLAESTINRIKRMVREPDTRPLQ